MNAPKDMPPRAFAKAVQDAEPDAWYPLVLSFTLVALGICLGGTLSYRNYERRFRTRIEEHLSAIAELKVDDLVLWRKERLGDANILLKNTSFSKLVQRFLDHPDEAEAQAQLRVWLERYQAANQYERIFLLDAQGVERMSTAGTAGPAAVVVSRRAGEILRSREIGFLDFYRNEKDQRVYLATLVPILEGPDFARALGVVVLNIDPAIHLYSAISRWPTPSRTAETLLVRRDGNDALFLNELKFRTNSALAFRIPLARTNVPAVKAVLGQQGIVEGIDYHGEPVVAALRAIPDSPWFMVARMDTAEVYAPLRARLWLTVLLMAALLLGSGASVGLVWRQQRVRYYRDRLEATAALQLSQQKLALHVEQTPLAVVEFDLEGRVREWNPAAVTVFGYSREEAIGQHWSFIVPAAIHGHLEGVWATIVAQRGGDRSTNENITKDGRTISCEWFNTPLIERDGRTIGVASLILDITERKRAQEALRESEMSLRETQRIARLGSYLLDVASGSWSSSDVLDKVFGIDEAYERSVEGWLALVHPDDRTMMSDYFRNEVLAQGRTFDKEYRIVRHNDQAECWVHGFGKLECDVEGHPLKMHGTIQDVTERRQAEEEIRLLNRTLEQRVKDRTAQLETANKELEAFSYSVSHDLRAPLRAIDGFARILEEDYTARLDDEGRRLLGIICGEAKRMGQLIDDLLAFSRMSRQQTELAQIDMTALAQAVFDEHAAQAPGRQLRLKLQPLPPARGDRALLRQALANLISNAIKYTRSRAVADIEIGGRAEGGENLYHVKDNGVGFDMKYAGKLFGVFQRLHTADEFEGNGVGLALVQRVIHRHGGRVWAEGKLNEGSAFYFTLPIGKDRI
jgi:PAS domain S-box-containing protein